MITLVGLVVMHCVWSQLYFTLGPVSTWTRISAGR